MQRWTGLCLVLCFGCDDQGAGPGEVDARRRIVVMDAAPVDAAPDMFQAGWDAAPTLEPDASPPDAAVVDAAPPCAPMGLRQCRIEGGDEVFVCGERGFDVVRCPVETVCRAGECIDPLEGCRPGERACAGLDMPAVCGEDGEGGRLVPTGELCPPDQVCASGRCTTPACAAATHTRSYLGCDYWVVDLQSFRYAGPEGDSVRGAPLGLVVMNPDMESPAHLRLLDATGEPGSVERTYLVTPPSDDDIPPGIYRGRRLRTEVQDAAGEVQWGGISIIDGRDIPPGGMGTFLIPHTGTADQRSHIRRRAWRLQTDSPVVAYQFNPLCCNFSFSNDASLLIPTHALGQRYRFLGTPTEGGLVGGLTVVGTEPDTEVVIDPRRSRVAPDPDRVVTPGADGKIRVTLQPHEVLTVNSRNGPFDTDERDLSGALLEASAPVAAFSSHQCARYPASLNACDHLEEQLFPVRAWGRSFVLVPLAQRGQPERAPTEVNYWKFVTDTDGTLIRLSVPFADLNPLPVSHVGGSDCANALLEGDTISLNAGESCEFGTQHPVAAHANQPVLVSGVMSGQASTGADTPYRSQAGDPSLFLVAPDRQYRADYPFLVPDTFARDMLTIVTNPDAHLVLDDVPLDLSDAEAVPGSTRVFLHVPLEDGPHRISGDQAFGILVYAYDDFVSYAFSGGLNLDKE